MEKKVLFIDDEAQLRRSMTFGLMQRGYEIEPCETGMKALKTLEMYKRKQVPLHYVVIDVRLPDIDGLKLLKVIKFNYPELPVVVITGYGSDSIANEAKLENADAYLEKPFTADELGNALEKIPVREPESHIDTAEKKSASAYLLLSFDESVNLSEVYNQLYFMDHVLYCDATKGDNDIVLLLQADDIADLNVIAEEKIRPLPGLKEMTFLTVDVPMLPDSVTEIIGSVDKALGRDKDENEAVNNRNFWTSASSYVFLEIEKEKLEEIYPVLVLNDHVVYCDYVRGRFDIALLMHGSSFAEIDGVIRRQIRSQNGVLRVKELPIIKLFEM